MAQYKVPQDVEADDKLLGPFSFRQFVYLLVCGGLIALAVGLFQIFPLLAILPVPPILLFAALALPLKKDQPMETYLAALVSYYIKPHNRRWEAGQVDNNITILAPKIEEEDKGRKLTGEEATHRLSFLADIVDSEGRAIKNVGDNVINEDIQAEAETVEDMFETSHFDSLEDSIIKDENNRHAEVIREMREAIKQTEQINMDNAKIIANNGAELDEELDKQKEAVDFSGLSETANAVTVQPEKPVEKAEAEIVQNPPKSSIIELSNNPDYSVATIAKEANRINGKEEGEVFISLH